jgi:hypothetical protein
VDRGGEFGPADRSGSPMRQRLSYLEGLNLQISRAYLLKEQLRHLWEQPTRPEAAAWRARHLRPKATLLAPGADQERRSRCPPANGVSRIADWSNTPPPSCTLSLLAK